LEETRVVHQSSGERNFHVFYQLCAGADDDERKQWQLESAQQYRFLNQGGKLEIDGVSDEDDFFQLRVRY
jgi:myosin heavy subunit